MKKLFLLAVSLLIVSFSFADTVVLKDGTKIQGKIMRADGNSVYLENVNNGLAISRDKIKSITYSDGHGAAQKMRKETPASGPKETKMTEKAILAGGCFWGLEELFRKRPGVTDTEVGYTGGDVKNATYENHGTHAEAIKVTFDPTKTSYRALLEFFFQTHDPTTKNRQGNDIGMSYRSAIFYGNEDQKKTAETLIKEIDASQKWPGPVVTQIAPAADFWSAEDYHQDYLQKNPGGYTCHYVRPQWKLQ